MRYLTIISLTLLLGACGKINRLKFAGEKVTKTVNACAESAKNICNKGTESLVSGENENQKKESADTKAANSWDTHMMLW